GAERERHLAHGDRLAAVGAFDHQQPAAAGLPDDGGPGIEEAGRRSLDHLWAGAGAGCAAVVGPVAASSADRSPRVASCPSLAPPTSAPSSTIRITRPGGPERRSTIGTVSAPKSIVSGGAKLNPLFGLNPAFRL